MAKVQNELLCYQVLRKKPKCQLMVVYVYNFTSQEIQNCTNHLTIQLVTDWTYGSAPKPLLNVKPSRVIDTRLSVQFGEYLINVKTCSFNSSVMKRDQKTNKFFEFTILIIITV